MKKRLLKGSHFHFHFHFQVSRPGCPHMGKAAHIALCYIWLLKAELILVQLIVALPDRLKIERALNAEAGCNAEALKEQSSSAKNACVTAEQSSSTQNACMTAVQPRASTIVSTAAQQPPATARSWCFTSSTSRRGVILRVGRGRRGACVSK